MLWLRDSFGDPMPPRKAASFSRTVQLDRQEALNPGGRFFELIERWKPDDGLITDVERHDRKARTVRFTIQPGSHLINLRSAPECTMGEIINRLCFDIDLEGACAGLKWVTPSLRQIAGDQAAGKTAWNAIQFGPVSHEGLMASLKPLQANDLWLADSNSSGGEMAIMPSLASCRIVKRNGSLLA